MKPLVLALFSLTICGCAGAQRQYSQQYNDCMSAARTHQDVQACRAGDVDRQNFQWDAAQNAVQPYLRELEETQVRNELAVKMAILQQEHEQAEPAIQGLEE